MLESVAEYVRSVEEPDTGEVDVHTITLVLGQHGEFDLTIQATDMDEMTEHRWTGVAHRNGGVSQFAEVNL
jgi:hypothetical protein